MAISQGRKLDRGKSYRVSVNKILQKFEEKGTSSGLFLEKKNL